MIANGGGIIAHLVHQAKLYIALEHGIVTGPLREVATVDEQQLGLFLAFLLDHGHPAQKAATTGQHRIGQGLLQREYAGMGIVGMEHHQFLRLLSLGS